ncbi:hypothetical protein FA95DRAFT_1605718 [Auriscalpium vulgare]|uniref:Uncharacterized protein n=1 Tax=Auriscalpium vulgare TaxID=40419 RepID=A0ACB8RUY3_9AGAM|nr:hypothetical protein FA95DRAFT_1605718 [Auriscalpium vulgare]
MDTLPKQFSSMSMSDAASRAPVRRSPRMTLPLPPDVDRNPRLQFYGVAVSEEWLRKYGEDHMILDGQKRNDLTLIFHAVNVLQRLTKIQDLAVEATSYDPVTFPDISPWDDGSVVVLAVCSTEWESYKCRPSQRKVDKLARLTGQTPKWWVDFNPPSYYM